VSDLALAQRTQQALASNGPLQQKLAGYRPRDAQLRYALAIADVIDDKETLIAEAGTGTGKTYGYLVPALLSGERVIISTGTKALQDQLYHRDLPRVRDALGANLKTALLKGRANYLCRYRMEQAKGESKFASRDVVAQFQRVLAWSGRTKRGDLAELSDLPEDTPLWPQITSNAENCLGSECPFWSECFVVKARQEAQAADVVVVNHHLLLADLAIKQEGFGEILPGASTFILDEAHQLPELAAQFFGENISARQLLDLSRDSLAECKEVPAALATIQQPVRNVEQAVREFRLAVNHFPQRASQLRLMHEHAVQTALEQLLANVDALCAALIALAETSPGFSACSARADVAVSRLKRWMNTDSDEEDVRWYELTQRGFSLQRTPLDVSAPLRQYREQSRAAWIFTSATLAVEGDFDHLSHRLGLLAPQTLLEQSPFDWHEQALCFMPRNMPEPNMQGYGKAVIDAVWPVLEASKGRAFLLFTSHRALREASDALKNSPWPLFVQGTAPRTLLLDQFRQSGNGVLLGAASFWEGVDVMGEALSVVVIDRLPFAAPDDPVLEARLDVIRRSGGNPFRDEQIPQAVIALKQGVGRLIRSHEDRGVLVLCDPRLISKSYGKIFLDSLPPFPRTRMLEDVQAFFSNHKDAPSDVRCEEMQGL
jgi:ATP-dependent DNA helicase DinG